MKFIVQGREVSLKRVQGSLKRTSKNREEHEPTGTARLSETDARLSEEATTERKALLRVKARLSECSCAKIPDFARYHIFCDSFGFKAYKYM